MTGLYIVSRRIAFVGCVIAVCTQTLNLANVMADEQMKSMQRRWSAGELYQLGTSRELMVSAGGVTLSDHTLIEDDAPACGYSIEGDVTEILEAGVVLKKTLIIERWPVLGASIVMLAYPKEPPAPNNGRHLVFNVNGHDDIVYELKHFWTKAPVPAEQLRQGENEVLVRVLEPDTKFTTYVALDHKYPLGSTTRLKHPNRSARSGDGGKTWTDRRLGAAGTADGEYMIRLNLAAYQPEGWLQSPIIDMAEASHRSALPPPARIAEARLKLDHTTPASCSLRLKVRTGSTHGFREAAWTEWVDCEGGVVPEQLLRNRFLQFKLVFTADTATDTPRLQHVSLQTRYAADLDALDGLRIMECVNRALPQSSFEIRHEDSHHPRLQQFRREHGLDRLVSGSLSEFEKILRLRAWVAGAWNWYLPGQDYPDFSEWDAVKIMAPTRDGKPLGGYCLHFAIAFMQACQSFGIPARIVNANYSVWGGHELTEVWSNEYAKWILMDAQFDTCFFDRESGTPLSALELHRIFLDEYYGDEAIDRDNWPREDFVARTRKKGEDLPIYCQVGGAGCSGTLTDYEWWKPPIELSAYCGGYGFLNMGMIRFLPRSNLVSQPLPMPLNHGRSVHWGWDGYVCWYDRRTPRSQEHRIFTNRESDLYWSVNAVCFSAAPAGAGRLRVSLATFSPDYDHYELAVDGKPAKLEDSDEHLWPLHAGPNSLEMRVVDGMGNRGPASRLVVDYQPPR